MKKLTSFEKIRILLLALVAIAGLAPTFAQAAAMRCAVVFTPQVRQMDSLKVAAVQFPLGERATPEAFLAKMDRYIVEAHENGAQLVVFPELITTDMVSWTGDYRAQLRGIAQNFTPRFEQWLSQRAQDLQISILGGTTPRMQGNEIVNTAIMAFPDGRTVLQDKMYLTPDEKNWSWKPGTSLKIINAPWGKSVITTCFDCEFAGLSKMLVKHAPEVFLVPSWTSSQSGLNRVDWSSRARAIEHYAYVVKTGTVQDPTTNEPHFGQASIIGPQDRGFSTETVEGQLNTPSMIYGTLDLARMRTQRQRMETEQKGFWPGNEEMQRTAPITIDTSLVD